jgi:hypothetical protein
MGIGTAVISAATFSSLASFFFQDIVKTITTNAKNSAFIIFHGFYHYELINLALAKLNENSEPIPNSLST